MANIMTVSRSIIDIITIKKSTVDDFSSIRYLHKMSTKVLGTAYHSDMELAARIALIETSQYAKSLLYQNLHTAWIENELIATAGWSVHDETEKSAYISSVYTHPLFAREGIGRAMLDRVETCAREAGFTKLMARANLNASSFFTAKGYELIIHDTESVGTDIFLPVAIMQKNVKAFVANNSSEAKEEKKDKEDISDAMSEQRL